MIQITPPQNPGYWINQRALTFSENDLDNPNRVAVSLVSGTVIMAYEQGVIDYAADGNFQKWTLKGYSTKLIKNDAHYVYARLSRTEKDALIVFSVNNYNLDGSITTVTGTDENGNDITETSDPSDTYYYMKIGELTATDGTSNRELTYDSGALGTKKGEEEAKSDLDEMFELNKNTTPWLITVKQMFYEFTVKNPITLLSGLIFKKGDVEKPITDIMRSTDSGDPNDANYVPIDDTTIPTTAWIQSRSDDRYLKKYEPDETEHRIKFYDGIEAGRFVKGMIGGSGTQLDGDGYGEMNGLTLREFLEVPELRFNRIDVVSGELWNSVAFGLIEKVDTDRQIAWIKLEERERCGLKVGDICRGIFADFGDGTQWEGVDECGFLHLYGFWTSYFTPTKVLEEGEGVFRFQYALKPGTTQHPTQSMKFAVYGHFYDTAPERQASAYSTRTYKRYLNKVNTWVIDPDKHIYAQYGDLNDLTIGGMKMSGYGSYQSNIYITGSFIEFTPQQLEQLKGEDAYSVTLSDYEGIVTIDDEGNIIGGEQEILNVVSDGQNVVTSSQSGLDSPDLNVVTAGYRLKTQVQAFRGSTPLFYSLTAPVEGSYIIGLSAVGCTAMVLNGVVNVTSVTDPDRCYVSVSVNCEGKASFMQTYYITAVREGKNPIVADIDNEMDSVACDSEGKVLFGLPVGCTVSMWAGVKPLSLDRLELTNLDDYKDASGEAGITVSADKNTGLIQVTAIADSAPRAIPLSITAYATYGGTQYHKDLVFTVNKVVAGENALLYKLSPSVSSVKVDDAGTMTATAISCDVVASDGSTIKTLDKLPDGVTIQTYRGDAQVPGYQYGQSVSVDSSIKSVTFKLYSGGQLIDVETVPILLDGSSPLIVDLDNEMQSVACDEYGTVLLGLPLSTGVKAYYGNKELEITSLEVGAVDGVTASYSGTTVTVSEITQDAVENIRIPITVKATHDKEYTRTVYLIVNKLKQGDSAVVVDLVPSVSAVKVDKEGNYSVQSVSCQYKVTRGRGGASVPNAALDNYTMTYAVDEGAEQEYTYGESIVISPEADKNINGAKTSVTFYLYYGGTLVDRETIPVVKDGLNGQDGQPGATGDGIASITEYYLASKSNSGVTTATSGWQTTMPELTETNKYLWNYEEVTYTSGKVENTTPVYIGMFSKDGRGIKSITEWYARSTSNVSAASTNITFYLYCNGALVDRETVPVLKYDASPVILNLDNEMQSVACDEDGTVLTELPITTAVKMYYGTTELTISDLSVDAPTGVTVTKTTSSVSVISITTDAADTLSITITAEASYGGSTYTKTGILTVKKTKKGDNTVVFDLIPSVDIIEVDSMNGGYTPAAVSCYVKQTTVDGDVTTLSSLPAEYEMTYRIDGGDETSCVYGTAVNVTSPESWALNPPVLNSIYRYLWNYEEVTYTDGSTSRTEPTVIGVYGDTGKKTSHYTIEAAVGTIGYTMAGGYSPSKFIVSEYYVSGSDKEATNTNYIHIYGLKAGESDMYLGYTSQVRNYTFDASVYQSHDFDTFEFRLQTGTSQYSSLVGTGTQVTVAVAKEGKTGVMPRYCGFYNDFTEYVYDTEYRDIVVYNGNIFKVTSAGQSFSGKTPPTTATSNDYWTVANKMGFVAMDTALIDNANIAGFIFTRLNSDLNNPIGKLASQNGTLELNAYTGTLTCTNVDLKGIIKADSGYIGGFTLSDGNLSSYLTTYYPDNPEIEGKRSVSISPSGIKISALTSPYIGNVSLCTGTTAIVDASSSGAMTAIRAENISYSSSGIGLSGNAFTCKGQASMLGLVHCTGGIGLGPPVSGTTVSATVVLATGNVTLKSIEDAYGVKGALVFVINNTTGDITVSTESSSVKIYKKGNASGATSVTLDSDCDFAVFYRASNSAWFYGRLTN